MTQRTADISTVNDRTRNIRTRNRRGVLTATALGVATIITVGVLAGVGGPHHQKLQLEDARMIIEFNSTDQDVGIQMFIDGEPWKHLRVFDTHERKILDITATQSLKRQGLTELFFESNEPALKEFSLKDFLARFPEGIYELEGVTIEGDEIEGEAVFTHVIPDAPVILSPLEGSEQDPDNTVVSWLPVPDPAGSTIQSYQVIVSQNLDVLPKREFSVFVDGSVNSVAVPPTFMVGGADYDLEVLAIEEGGNQTITTGTFSTMP